MRVDVDFNQRDRDGHVIARVPGHQAARLAPGTGYTSTTHGAVVGGGVGQRIDTETRVAAFDVDWHSFADAEVADLTVDHRQWFVGVPPGEGHSVLSSAVAENASQPILECASR